MSRTLCAAAVAALLLCPCGLPAQVGKFTVKTEKAGAPAELKAEVAKLLGDEAVHVCDARGSEVCTLWLRREVPADATPEQIKNGLTYAELQETIVLGAVKFEQPWADYRKQKIKPGVYTLRFAVQPMSGDHMGTSPEKNFCLLVAADEDTNPAPLEFKALVEKSRKSMGTEHPGVLMLFEYSKPGAIPQLATKLNNHTVLNLLAHVRAAGQQATLGIGLTLVGHVE